MFVRGQRITFLASVASSFVPSAPSTNWIVLKSVGEWRLEHEAVTGRRHAASATTRFATFIQPMGLHLYTPARQNVLYIVLSFNLVSSGFLKRYNIQTKLDSSCRFSLARLYFTADSNNTTAIRVISCEISGSRGGEAVDALFWAVP